jgi:hypothetical protein
LNGLGRDIDKLNDKLTRLWPEGDSGNGNGHGYHKSFDDYDDDIKNAIIDAAERWNYHEHKEQWIFHRSSYYWRGLNAYDGQGCNGSGCIPECPYYAAEGRLSLPYEFYENFISNPYSYQDFLEFIGIRIIHYVNHDKSTRSISIIQASSY